MMTATISPMVTGNSAPKRLDPDVRMQDYKEALRFYLSRPKGFIDRVLFLENSGANLDALREIAERENPRAIPVEFFQAVSDCHPEYGKGHSELQLMDRAFAVHLEVARPTSRFWKVTGRIIIPQIERLIETAPDSADIYIDMRFVPSFLRFAGTDRWADTRIFAVTPDGYRRYFFGLRDHVGTPGNTHVLELALFPRLLEAYEAGESVAPRFAVQPLFKGIGATSLKQYDTVLGQSKTLLRAIFRRLFPNLWL